ncbi:arsenate reductase 2.1 [Achaetomium macrosporum]|uniref:Arsenate reductase 2.1 n=1 Tax=Achaetomium macrosporum TaxID=79813 RepID=A0AAN7HBA9_9PEZI|nr:arsenate reductase 2.1 [Achaetomium macrosporum]
MATIGTLQRLSAASLSKMLLAAQEAAAAGDPNIAIIDVRDDDYIGGHIKGSQNVPSRTLDAMLPTLVRQLQDKETVVFHCALSQQRGPAAALRYIRERERILASLKGKKPSGDGAHVAKEDGVTAAVSGEGSQEVKEQKVYVLDRGFVGWQEAYGTDERLTEGYRKDLWEDGYWG